MPISLQTLIGRRSSSHRPDAPRKIPIKQSQRHGYFAMRRATLAMPGHDPAVLRLRRRLPWLLQRGVELVRLRGSRPSLPAGVAATVTLVALCTVAIYPLKRVTSVSSFRRVSTRRRRRLDVLGTAARSRNGGSERRGIQLLSPPAGWTIHDLRKSELGCVGDVSGRGGRVEHGQRGRPIAVGGGGSAPCGGGPDRGDGATDACAQRGGGGPCSDRPPDLEDVRAAVVDPDARSPQRRCATRRDPAARWRPAPRGTLCDPRGAASKRGWSHGCASEWSVLLAPCWLSRWSGSGWSPRRCRRWD